jgi:phosphopantothenoylcysteine decarboxylase/phosphopantothenate--cysteine ligase
MGMHPSKAITGMWSDMLLGRKIVLGITGSIAAVESFELARDLMRHGADVYPVLSPEGAKIITPYTMSFATGNEAIVSIGPGVEHVQHFGMEGGADLLLIAPATANTIGKIALGVDDTAVTTFATTAIGAKRKVMLAPAMHAVMFDNPAVQKNLETLKGMGVVLVGPRMEGGKAKIAARTEIVEAVLRELGPNDMRGQKVLVIGGSTEEMIDSMRTIGNKGTGEMAVELALAAYRRGAEVELWMGACRVPLPSHIATKKFTDLDSLIKMMPQASADLTLVPAALSDFRPGHVEGKLPSDLPLTLEMESAPKVLPLLRKRKGRLVGFKAEYGLEEEELVAKASARLEEYRLDAIVANDLKHVKPGSTSALFITSRGVESRPFGSKRVAADAILAQCLRLK